MDDLLDRLTIDGYAILEGVLSRAEVDAAREAAARALSREAAADAVLSDRGGSTYGARNLLAMWPEVVDFVHRSDLASRLREILGPGGGLVRGLWFDKPPGQSWSLPWHRDKTVAVKEHGAMGIFNKPTVKAGVPHVEAPIDLLSTMVTLRIHLDPMNAENGPLLVMPGSHMMTEACDRSAVTVHCEVGDVFVMRPLLLHASAKAHEGHHEHRRIVHLEFSPVNDLADGYRWHDFIGIRAGVGPK